MRTILTERQQAIYRYVEGRIEAGESAPTCREICDQFGYRSPKAAADQLAALERKGYITRDSKRARGIRLTRQPHGIPLLGQIQAGRPSEVQPFVNEYLSISPESFGIRDQTKAFALRVRGDSMIGRHVLEGDIVILEHDVTPCHGDVVAALIDSETTLKTFLREAGKAWLRAENPRYTDLVPALDLQIQGVARGIVRYLA